VAVDVALLTVRDEVLQVVVVDHRHGGPALPGTFLHVGELLSEAAARALQDKAGLSDVTFTQLRVFDKPGRDDRGWVLTVGHSGALSTARIPADVRSVPIVDDRPAERLLFDHDDIVTLAVEKLREQYARTFDPAELLPDAFTVLEVRRIYQAIFGRTMVKDTFRRYIIDALEPTGELASAFGRPAELFRRRPGAQLPTGALAFFASGRR